MKKIITTTSVLLITVSQSFAGFGGFRGPIYVDPGQVAVLQWKEAQTAVEMVKQVQNQIKQIGLIEEQLDLHKIKNDILGDYGDFGNDITKTIGNLENTVKVEDLEGLLEKIQDTTKGINVEDIFEDNLDVFGKVEKPKSFDKAKYKKYASYETAYKSAEEVQKRVNKDNVALAAEARNHRAAASTATNQATYQQHIDKAEAAEKAIKRNQAEAELASANAELIKEAADMHDAKVLKAALDRAAEEEEEEINKAEKQFEDNILKIN